MVAFSIFRFCAKMAAKQGGGEMFFLPRVHNSNNFLIDGNILMSEKEIQNLAIQQTKQML